MNDLEHFRTTMLPRHIEAEQAFVRGDPRPRMALWSQRDPVTLFGAIGMSESGWDQLSQTFPWVASRFSEVSDYRIEVELVEVSGDLAYVLWFERCDMSIAGRPVEPVTVRVTHLYRREEGEWKIVHRHGDNPRPPGFVRGPGDVSPVEHALGGDVTFWARGAETGGALTIAESEVQPGMGPPLHVHVNDDEFVYVLEGRLRIRLEHDIHDLPAGSFAFIPKGARHTWQNAGETTARFLFGFGPAAPGMERFFERTAELPSDTRLAEAFSRFAGDAGMEVLGPPMSASRPPALHASGA
jgi:quercetin dioxygenase-like cupin family protein/ketosteroid isomerase-like protein